MSTVKNQPQTKVLETVASKGLKSSDLEKKIGRPLGSPINGKEVGQTFDATLTGKIEIRDFNGNKGAYYTTKEGFSIRVNASFDPSVHKEGAVMKCVCREIKENKEQGIMRDVKYTAFVD